MAPIGLVVVLALALLAAPPGAAAQPASKPAKIGMLFSIEQPISAPNLDAFRAGLRELGYVEGTTVVLVSRYGLEGLPEHARELVSLKVDVLVVSSDLAVVAARRATETIPIVMTVSSDPVGSGFVASLAHPGGNVTGLSWMSAELSAKRLELLKGAIPKLSRVALVWDPDVRGALLDYKETESAARALRLQLQSVEVSRAEDLDRTLSALVERHAEAFVVFGPSPVTFANRARIASFAQQNQLPSMYSTRAFVEAGGFMSYGPSLPNQWKRAATYVDRILKGAKPGDLPVEQPTSIELVINLKTARALKLTVPPALLRRADHVIE